MEKLIGHFRLIPFGTVRGGQLLSDACLEGKLHMVKHLIAVGRDPELTMDYAASRGHLSIVRYLDSIHQQGTIYGVKWAIENGHLEVVKYLEKMSPNDWGDSEIGWALSGQRLDIIKYLYPKYPYSRPIHLAVRVLLSGNLEIIKYFYGAGMECVPRDREWWYLNHWRDMGDTKSVEIIKYLEEKGFVNVYG